jgi:hypothetical protein
MTSDERPGAPGDVVGGRIGTALDEIVPSAAPVSVVITKGKRIRVRRRAGAAAGLAVLAVAFVTAPRLGHDLGLPSPPPPAVHQPEVTIDRLGPLSVHGLIAKGTIDKSTWTIRLGHEGRRLCIEASDGPGMACQQPGNYRTSGAPALLQGGGDERRYFLAGPVASNVRQVRFVLADGTVLRTDSVRYGQLRWIGLEVPTRLRIVRAIAYSEHGEVGHAIPFYDSPAGIPTFVAWQRPGQEGQARITRRIGSGVTSGTRWSVIEHTGPWGYCVTVMVGGQRQNTDCTIVFAGHGNGLTSSADSSSTTGKLPWWFVGAVPNLVSYLRFAISDGRTIRVPAVAAGRGSFYAFALGVPNVRVLHWASYDRSGRRVSGGRGLP